MFTSRAEYRMSLRADNADIRLTRKGMDYGFVRDEERIACLEDREYIIDDRIEQLRKFNLKVPEWAERGGNDLMGGAKSSEKTGQKKTAEEVLGMPHVTLKAVEDIMIAVSKEERAEAANKDDETDATNSSELPQAITASPQSVHDTVEAVVKYKNYVVRQNRDMESWRKAQGARIPPDVIYDQTTLPTLSSEELEKLNAARPNTFAEASQISGITPQSLIYLHHYIRMRSRKREGKSDTKKVSYQKQNLNV
mmetsp:Transcript_24017/g.33720  ORF Transcript_24017/g.33720 Transcript_24017/m.33720 type:complete len:252 (-) Transcript_24017:22-777(-)